MASNKTRPGSKPGAASGPKRPAVFSWPLRYWRFLLIILSLVFGATGWWYFGESAVDVSTANAQQINANFLKMPGGPSADGVPVSQLPQERERKLTELAAQVVLADHTLCSYREATKYPQESRPIAEHSDQTYPNQVVKEKHAMRKEDGKTDSHVQIQTTQSHIYLASNESVIFSVNAADEDGKVLPIFVTRALARGITLAGAREAPQVAVSFNDDGSNGDVIARDNTVSAMLTPGTTGFAQFNGTIRVEVRYNVGDRPGVVLFDLIYSSEVPAIWTGPIREAVENGSLNFYLKADVRAAGRYMVSGRVDDAKGKPYAFVTFNDVLPQGPNEIKLSLFGKLLRDQEPVFPLSLRDVDSYLLKENTDPDRALMARIVGPAYTSKMHSTKNFSDEEWQSEERARYLTEFGKDLDQAKAALLQLDPSMTQASMPKSECAAASVPSGMANKP